MLLDLLITMSLVLLNGFFVAAEFAFVKVRGSQLDIKANQGSSRAKTAKQMLENLDAYISATQLGITLASLALGWIGESVVAKVIIKTMHTINIAISPEMVHTAAIPITFVFITVLHIVLGEQIPKSIAIRHALNTTLFVVVPMKLFYTVFKPFIWTLNTISIRLIKMLGLESADGQNIHSEEEIKILLTESEEGGAIKRSEHELIQNVFDFDDRTVKQVMVPRNKISAINIESTNPQIIEKVLDEGYSRLPVYKDSMENILGIVYTKDLLKTFKHQNFSLKDIIRPAYFVPASKKINELLRELQTQHIQMAIVTNEFGGTYGLITMEDIIEELVGEIQDEYDEEKPIVEKKSETEYIVNALTAITDVNEFLPISLPENTHYDTVSGMVNYIFGRIPALGEQRIFGGYEITILKRFKHSVEFVRFRVIEENEQVEEKNQ
ncbi:MAG: HlyC/CorC family transporter [Bacteroidetes bacterium]|nr:HlyC/CorC family transporter [Bacteroidota bacterium]